MNATTLVQWKKQKLVLNLVSEELMDQKLDNVLCIIQLAVLKIANPILMSTLHLLRSTQI